MKEENEWIKEENEITTIEGRFFLLEMLIFFNTFIREF